VVGIVALLRIPAPARALDQTASGRGVDEDVARFA
jgi:hypothetical protein